ncbi:MAG: aminoacyl-tRNA hydrolase [Chloroflexota bacterium]
MALFDKYDYLIAGLGNPGAKYAATRHNVGWMAADRIAEKYEVNFSRSARGFLKAKIKIEDKVILLIKPTTFMNLSGEPIAYLAKKHKIAPSQVIAITDEYNFPVGKMKLKKGGSSGGHNGIQSIIDELGRPDFWRLRLGIDKNFDFGGMVDYVLSEFAPREMDDLGDMLTRAAESIKLIVEMTPDRAMGLI